MTTPHKPNVAAVCARFGCTEEQARAQYRACAEQLQKMRAKAAASRSGKHRGYTVPVLDERIAAFLAA